MNQETIPCKYCGKPTLLLGTKECDGCHELRVRIERDPEMAHAMLTVIRHEWFAKPGEAKLCKCGYPMPCVKTVPSTLCRQGLQDAAPSSQSSGPDAERSPREA